MLSIFYKDKKYVDYIFKKEQELEELVVENFSSFKKRLEQLGVKIINGNDFYFKIKDPDGGGLTVEHLSL